MMIEVRPTASLLTLTMDLDFSPWQTVVLTHTRAKNSSSRSVWFRSKMERDRPIAVLTPYAADNNIC